MRGLSVARGAPKGFLASSAFGRDAWRVRRECEAIVVLDDPAPNAGVVINSLGESELDYYLMERADRGHPSYEVLWQADELSLRLSVPPSVGSPRTPMQHLVDKVVPLVVPVPESDG